jgi:hypothetical protein
MNRRKTLLLLAVFFFHGHPAHCLDAHYAPDAVAALVLQGEAQDSTDAADVFLVPFFAEIDSAARKHGLPPSLLAAFIQEESAFNQWATRVETHYLRKKKVIAEARRWSRKFKGIPTEQTELYARSSSWGLMQVMGQVAREQGFDRQFLQELISPINSIDEGAKLLVKNLKRYKGDTLSAISAYNQGNNRKSGGTFVNARYVYRVSVAWQAYRKIFTTIKAYDEAALHRIDSVLLTRRSDGIVHNIMQDHTAAGDHYRYAAYRLDAGQHCDTAALVYRQGTGESGQELFAADRRFDLGALAAVAGFVALFGFGRYLYQRSLADFARHHQRVPGHLDERVQHLLGLEPEDARHDHHIHGV